MILEEKLKNLPDSPGVYLMKDEIDNIIYVGKAVSLRNRVRQYFQSSKNHPPKVRAMVANIRDFEYIITDSELEALILECNLIKEHRPKYNVLLKDDKSYPYIVVTTEEDYPRIMLTRKVAKDKNLYYGPYSSTKVVRDTIEVIRKLFPIRTCKKNLNNIKKGDRPCLYYYINQCQGPCLGNVPKEEYGEVINDVCKFLDGKYEDIIKGLRDKMNEAAADLNFEKAASIRDKILSIEKVMETQKIVSVDMLDQDIIAIALGELESIVQMFFIRKGKLTGSEQFVLDTENDNDIKEILGSFIKQFYLTASFIPKEILLQHEIDEAMVIERWLTSRRGNRVYVKVPQRGDKKKLVDMALKNSMEALENLKQKTLREEERTIGASEELTEYLDLPYVPTRIEAFDISNIQGANSVASMVVFEKGKPKKQDYRRFRIRGIMGPDDYSSMSQVIMRRFKRGLEEKRELEAQDKDPDEGKFSRFPDLLLIDGGRGQLNVAASTLRELGIDYIPVISLAEKFDEIYTEEKEEPLVMQKNSLGLQLLQRIRDEAHRFALTYHRSLHSKNSIRSVLEDVPHIGPSRRRALLKHFGSIRAIRESNLEELSKVAGMNRKAALSIIEYFGMDHSDR
ncbi:MAG: excinuclease ABC subunit UvrC [Clostridiales bacterium]|jgi:excinuclease ABC subunit C|nr:excinuclease ABC subunit UvrC [Clostridiales bacterium]